MENEIYQILKKHKLPLKKREEVLTDLLLLFSVVEQREQLRAFKDFLQSEYNLSVSNRMVDEYIKQCYC